MLIAMSGCRLVVDSPLYCANLEQKNVFCRLDGNLPLKKMTRRQRQRRFEHPKRQQAKIILSLTQHKGITLQTDTGSPHISPRAAFSQAMNDSATRLDLICFSHLRWHFVTQRPQHLLTRCAQERHVFYWEEPYWDADDKGNGTPTLEIMQEAEHLWVIRPHLPRGGNADAMQRQMLASFLDNFAISRYVRWYYTPMALSFTSDLQPEVTVYDCMDELSGFQGAPPELRERELALFNEADVVFTGGHSLYEAKRKQHANVHAFPSSIDVAHFAQAKTVAQDPADQAEIAHPRAGFFGVLDERLDLALIAEIARLREDVQFIFIGPVVKIDSAILPQAKNIHYLGSKSYAELPRYLAGWDVALLPFALNEATRYISPTKTPEYLAACKPVVSTAIHDVVADYGRAGLVAIAHNATEFAQALGDALTASSAAWTEAVAGKLASGSWDCTWQAMWREIDHVASRSAHHRPETVSAFRIAPVTVIPIDLARPRPVRSESYDYLVVGAGLAGGVLAERLANGMGKRVLIIDKRDHIGGNTFDYRDAAGILIHKYGPHIFHTNSTEVMQYLSRFTAWRDYEHRVLAQVDGKLLPIPINLDTVERLYGLSLDADAMRAFLEARAEIKPLIRTSEDIVVSRVGRDLYEKFFRNYTRKQWGLDPSELDASVAGRIPVRFDRDDRYFTDTYQAMPALGFTAMFERLLDSKKITIKTGVEYSQIAHAYPGARIIFTGPVDEYFDYRFGPLPYRSLEFKHVSYAQERFQQAAVINYPNDHAYTRVTEFKYLTGQVAPHTSVVYEYPKAEGDPYYPIPRPENAALYAKYKELADRTPEVRFVGRLATYKYYNMDQVVAQALTTYRAIVASEQMKYPVTATESRLVSSSI